MGNFPMEVTEEENRQLRHPFLKTEEYDQIRRFPDGPVLLVRYTGTPVGAEELRGMAEINRAAAARRAAGRDENP